jgi:thermitase
MGCNATLPTAENESGGGGTQPPVNPPVVTSPIKYNFYEPRSEENLKADTNYGYLIAKVGRGVKESAFARFGLEIRGKFELGGSTYYYLHKDSNVLEALNGIKKIPGILYIEPDMKLHSFDLDPDTYGSPGDPRVKNEQWGAHLTQALDAWKKHGFGANRPVVVNVDTGVRFSHEDLNGVVTNAFSWFSPDGNSTWSWEPYHDTDPYPIDYMQVEGAFTTDRNGHGTHTTGTIAAIGNNDKGIAGMAWNVDLVSYKGIADGGWGSDWSIYGSIWHLAKWRKDNLDWKGVIPVNMSLGAYYGGYFAVDMIEYGLQNNIMVIAASGNNSQRLHVYPAVYTGTIAVGATTSVDKRAVFSNYGQHLSVVAPGQNIISSDWKADNSYENWSGTSMATPHVTGLVAYMLTFNPDLTPGEIRTYIEQNADKIEGATGYTEEHGHGRINVLKTIDAVVEDVQSEATPPCDYARSSVIIRVSSLAGGEPAPIMWLGGIPIYLYECDPEDGSILNYVAITTSGESWVNYDPDNPPDSSIPWEDGLAYFPMLKPGYYVAKAFLSLQQYVTYADLKELGSTDVFEVKPDEARKEVVLAFKEIGMLHIHTFPTSHEEPNWQESPTDTVIEVFRYNPGGWGLPPYMEWITQSYDVTYYDNINLLPQLPPGEYYVRIRPYQGEDVTDPDLDPIQIAKDACGEYALVVSTSWPMPTWPAPGTYDNPSLDAIQGSDALTWSQAQSIQLDQIAYGKFVYGEPNSKGGKYSETNPNGDWYKFTIR